MINFAEDEGSIGLKHSQAYSDADNEIEGVFAYIVLGMEPESGIDLAMARAVQRARNLGLTKDEIEKSIRSNMLLYGVSTKTSPVAKWLEE